MDANAFPPPYQIKPVVGESAPVAAEPPAEAPPAPEPPAEPQIAPRRLRIFLHDPNGKYHDINLRTDLHAWPDFIAQMIACHGILLEKGWIPEHMIMLIAELEGEQPVEPKYSGNVVDLRKP